MKYFIAIDEDLLQQLWMYDPSLVAPFSRPFCPSDLRPCALEMTLSDHALTLRAAKSSSPQEDDPQWPLPGILAP